MARKLAMIALIRYSPGAWKSTAAPRRCGNAVRGKC